MRPQRNHSVGASSNGASTEWGGSLPTNNHRQTLRPMNAPKMDAGNHARILDSMRFTGPKRAHWSFRKDDHARKEASRLAAESFLRQWRETLASQANVRQ